MAMMYYIPPLSPVVSIIEDDLFKLDIAPDARDFEMFDRLDSARLPVKYLANLFSAGNEADHSWNPAETAGGSNVYAS